MQRNPLQIVNSNVQRPAFPIFDDFQVKSVSKNRQVNGNKPSSRTQVGAKNSLATALYMIVLLQRNELKLANLRSSFLKLVNHSLACKIQKQSPTHPSVEPRSSSKPTTTPKKRRLDDDNSENVEQTNEMGTPQRLANTSRVATPHNYTTKRTVSTPYQNRSEVGTPARPPMADISNKVNRSLVDEEKMDINKIEASKEKVPAVSLAERLEMVEASLHKLKVMELRSPSKACRTPNVHQNPMEQEMKTQTAPSSNCNPEMSTFSNTARPAESVAPSDASSKDVKGSGVPLPAAAAFVGRGSSLHKPVVAEADVLQAAIQRATKASIKTLLKAREAPSQISQNSSELRDKLHTYKQDSAKVEASLLPSAPSAPAAEYTSAQVNRLEVSIVNYHHATSDLFPLSPLGDQSVRGTAVSPVPLAQMSILADKMQSWKDKYARPKA